MAPVVKPREPSIDETEEREKFIEELRQYHEKRGTFFDPEPKLGARHVDLFRLWNIVMERGGYDIVSAEKLAWKKVGEHFSYSPVQPATFAFNLKTVFYKFLAAYEISQVHGKEPPPKEILENLTARGGDLLNRTLENYHHPGRVEDGSDSESDNAKEDSEDPSSAGRATRGLRQAPAQRILFQPDMGSSRHSRPSGQLFNSSPSQPLSAHLPVNPSSISYGVASYEPRLPQPVMVRPVVTPSNNPDLFREKQRAMREREIQRSGQAAPSVPRGMMLPGTGFDGPNIYIRTMLALKSGIEEEQAYALHHLVKISHERGDKYKFSAFPGLAEALIEKVLEISQIFYDIQWSVSFDDAGKEDPFVLDGVSGTASLLETIRNLKATSLEDEMETDELSAKLSKINEAALVLRNMVMLEDNAAYLARLPLVCDFITIALNLPKSAYVIELQHYALDIAEQITKYFLLEPSHPLYQSLLSQLESMDRGAVLTALRAIGRISMNLEENNRLRNVSLPTVQKIMDWTLLDDEELVNACLDFLYQYSALEDNLKILTDELPEAYLAGFVNRLVQLLTFGSQPSEKAILQKKPQQKALSPHETIPNIPKSLMSQLVEMDEPARSTNWLKACFEEDPHQSITQIALWQAYQTRFSDAGPNAKPLLPAADFIKNVSTTFKGATAQVLQTPTARFIIRGICARSAPMDPNGQVYRKCRWLRQPSNPRSECGEFQLTARDLWVHILQDHLQIQGDFSNGIPLLDDEAESNSYTCLWGGACYKTFDPAPDSLLRLSIHLKTHLPDNDDTSSGVTSPKKSVNGTDSDGTGTTTSAGFSLNTTVDERGDAAGLPLTAALVLRNIARNLPKKEGLNGFAGGGGSGRGGSEEGEDEKEKRAESASAVTAAAAASANSGAESWTKKLFQPVMQQLWFIMAFSKPLAGYIADLTAIIERE